MAELIRVLIVDDDPLVRVGLSLVLGAGPDLQVVGEASDGVEAVEAARRLLPDVVLMDIRMPRMDGLAATAELRRDGPHPAIIVLTTFDTDDHLLGALRRGANGFLLKDIAPTEILAAVRRAAAGESILAPSVVPRLIGYAVGRTGSGTPAGDRTPAGDGLTGSGPAGSGLAGSGPSGSWPRGSWPRGSGPPGSGPPGSGGGAADGGRVGEAGGAEEDGRFGQARRAAAVLDRLSERELDVAEAVATGRSNAEIAGDLHMSVPTVKAYVSRLLEKLGCTNRVQVAILVHEARYG